MDPSWGNFNKPFDGVEEAILRPISPLQERHSPGMDQRTEIQITRAKADQTTPAVEREL